jgi:hypothetical protein
MNLDSLLIGAFLVFFDDWCSHWFSRVAIIGRWLIRRRASRIDWKTYEGQLYDFIFKTEKGCAFCQYHHVLVLRYSQLYLIL